MSAEAIDLEGIRERAEELVRWLPTQLFPGHRTIEKMAQDVLALVERVEAQQKVIEASRFLLALKDGPRDTPYLRDKPGAWKELRRALDAPSDRSEKGEIE